MQRGWVGEVAGLFFFSLQKLFPMRADEVGTNHPIGYKSIRIDYFTFIHIKVDMEKNFANYKPRKIVI